MRCANGSTFCRVECLQPTFRTNALCFLNKGYYLRIYLYPAAPRPDRQTCHRRLETGDGGRRATREAPLVLAHQEGSHEVLGRRLHSNCRAQFFPPARRPRISELWRSLPQSHFYRLRACAECCANVGGEGFLRALADNVVTVSGQFCFDPARVCDFRASKSPNAGYSSPSTRRACASLPETSMTTQ